MTTNRVETGPFVIWFGYYWQPSRPRPRPTNGFDSVYTWGGSTLGRTSSMEFGGPVRSGSGRFGSCLHVHYEIILTSSSWIDPER